MHLSRGQLGLLCTCTDSPRSIAIRSIANPQDLAQHSPVPVINALSHAWHPTQILADLLTLYEAYSPPIDIESHEFHRGKVASEMFAFVRSLGDPLAVLKGKKITWVGDMNNVSWELMATCPRLGMEMSVAAPKGYDGVDEEVMAKMYATSPVVPFLSGRQGLCIREG